MLSARALQIIADDKIRAAIETGEFDHLPGLDKPLPLLEEPYDDNWWLRRKLQAEALQAKTAKTAKAADSFEISSIQTDDVGRPPNPKSRI